MSWLEGAIKFIAGGSLILLISFLGKSNVSYLAGLAVLFPIVTVVGYSFLSLSVAQPELKKTILFSIFSLPTVFIFLLIFYFYVDKISVNKALLLGIIGWIIAASIIIGISNFAGWGAKP